MTVPSAKLADSTQLREALAGCRRVTIGKAMKPLRRLSAAYYRIMTGYRPAEGASL
jgi:hypothetical protein